MFVDEQLSGQPHLSPASQGRRKRLERKESTFCVGNPSPGKGSSLPRSLRAGTRDCPVSGQAMWFTMEPGRSLQRRCHQGRVFCHWENSLFGVLMGSLIPNLFTHLSLLLPISSSEAGSLTSSPCPSNLQGNVVINTSQRELVCSVPDGKRVFTGGACAHQSPQSGTPSQPEASFPQPASAWAGESPSYS